MLKVNQRSLSERFEVAFNRIHKRLLDIVKGVKTDKFTVLVSVGAKKHSLIRAYEEELYQYARLRNAIVHEKIDVGYYIAEPHPNVVARIEKICEQFEKPKSVLSIASKPVLYFYDTTSLQEALHVISHCSFNQFPVYHQEEYRWLLTTTGIVKWMAENLSSQQIHLESVAVSDLAASEKDHFVRFLSKDATIFDVEELFEEYYSQNKKLEAVIITKNGKHNEAPLGIITSWDLVEVDLLE